MANNQQPEREVREPGYPSYPSYPQYPGYPEYGGGGNMVQDVQRFWYVFLEKIWLVGAIVLVGTLLAAAYVLPRPKLYQATATVQVEGQDKSAIGSDAMRDQTSSEQLNTIVGKFQSRPLLAAVLVQAGLLSSNSTSRLSWEPSDPASGATLAVDTAASSVTNARVFSSNSAGAMLGNVPTKEDLNAIDGFSGRVKVALRRSTRLIDITVTDRNPAQAAKLANLMVENYLKQEFSIKSTTSRSQSEFFKAEYDRLAKKLQASEQALQDYKEQVRSVNLANQDASQSDELQEYQRQLTESQAEVIRAKSAYDESLKMGTNISELMAYTAIASDPQVQLCQTAIAQKEADLLQLKQQYREKNPKFILAVNTLAGLKDQMVKTVLDIRHRIQESFRLPYENALATKKGLENELTKAQTKNLDLSQKAIHYNLLAREVAADRAMFDSISQHLNEMSVSSELAPVNISMVVPALPPEYPSSPQVRKVLGIGFFGSLGFGLFLVFLLDRFNTVLRTVDEAEEFLGVPVLAALPHLKLENDNFKSQLVVANSKAHSAEVELFRTLRASVSMQEKDKERRSFLFVSSFPKEGKSFTSSNFAASLAQQGLRTLLIDLDLRKPRVEEFLTGESRHIPGMTEILQNKAKLGEVVQKHPDVPNFNWVGAGTIVSHPAELLSQGLFKPVLEQALKEYDRVVIDSPPLHPVKDALMASTEVSAVIILVNGRKTARKAVAKTLQWLQNANAPVAGVVLNLLPRRRKGHGYYYYDYYGYSYGKYGEGGNHAK